MSDFIAFTSVKKPYGWLGNMAAFPLQYEGLTWRTPEALFQALRFEDPAVREDIRGKTSPMSAKFAAKAKRSRMVVAPMSGPDAANMEAVLRLKLRQHPDLRRQLLETGDRPIIEDTSRRPNRSGLYWGAALRDGRWVGENILGKIWMKLRDELRAEGSGGALARPA